MQVLLHRDFDTIVSQPPRNDMFPVFDNSYSPFGQERGQLRLFNYIGSSPHLESR
jgi:hypothetical protein